ncbi:MAG: phosphoribosyltransferase, partial [Candidatus Omnitrophota bacterium]
MFEDRKDAGEKLARALDKYKDKGAIILAIPRGGVEVGYQVAKHLNAEFSIIIARKLQFPDNPEAGFGAIAEDGSAFIFEFAKDLFSKEMIGKIAEGEQREIKRRVEILRGGEPLPDIKGKVVIIVDDGIAMGSTMRTAIMLCKNKKAAKIVVGSPVAG